MNDLRPSRQGIHDLLPSCGGIAWDERSHHKMTRTPNPSPHDERFFWRMRALF